MTGESGGSAEYRVVWQREGRRRQTRIFQSWPAAYRKFAAVVATDEAKKGTPMGTLPDLVGPPVIEVRRCSPWEPQDGQPDPTPNASVVESLAWRFGLPAASAVGTGSPDAEVPF